MDWRPAEWDDFFRFGSLWMERVRERCKFWGRAAKPFEIGITPLALSGRDEAGARAVQKDTGRSLARLTPGIDPRVSEEGFSNG